MKNNNLFYLLLLIVGMVATSCEKDDENTTNGGGNKAVNYWESNAWTRQQLKGKVKYTKETTEYSTSEVFFNDNGFVEKTIYIYENGTPEISIYEYNDEGQLISAAGEEFTYANHGKYIPLQTFHIHMDGLIKNLATMKYEGDTEGFYFDFEGDILHHKSIYNENEYTTLITYDGKYPVKINDPSTPDVEWGEYMKASYQENGMFDVYEEGFFSTGENPYLESRKHHYKKDNEYLLIDKIVRENTDLNGISIMTQTYEYNEYKDVIRTEELYKEGEEEPIISQTETFEYIYDSKGNWTKKTEVSDYGQGSQSHTFTIDREIEYFD